MSAARRLRDTKLIGTLTERKKEIVKARAARAEAADYIDLVLQHPTHPEANQIVGSYYCLVKQRWEDGLPLLARAAFGPAGRRCSPGSQRADRLVEGNRRAGKRRRTLGPQASAPATCRPRAAAVQEFLGSFHLLAEPQSVVARAVWLG